MSGVKNSDSKVGESVSSKLQQKFDSVFDNTLADAGDSETLLYGDDEANIGDNSMVNTKPKVNLELGEEVPELDLERSETTTTKSDFADKSTKKENLDFTLNFDLSGDETDLSKEKEVPVVKIDSFDVEEGLNLDSYEDIQAEEGTKKTVLVDIKAFEEIRKEMAAEHTLSEATEDSINSSLEMMSRAETKANIESTIKDILRPKFDNTKEIDTSDLEIEEELEETEIDFNSEESTDDMFTDSLKAFEKTARTIQVKTGHTGEFDIQSEDLTDFSEIGSEELFSESSVIEEEKIVEEKKEEVFTSTSSLGETTFGIEDSLRVQATIRQLREEREDLLLQIKNLKRDGKELEQDNLSLKANLDEAKIEITILRKRHTVELEDLKYRLSMNDEKKALAEEKAKQADLRREKLEQKVRIDFNQVKQREKELEGKLELLSMDVDAQVQSRDLKILELRRKIDALEFNMENTSIKEQKSLDDKRRLEDRLNKIMKTLRNSIKNLEEDIDLAHEDEQNADKS